MMFFRSRCIHPAIWSARMFSSAPLSMQDIQLQWTSRYRPLVNDIVQDILHSHRPTNLAFDMDIWKNIVNSFRRKLIKYPLEAMKKEHILQFCQDMKEISLKETSSTKITEIKTKNCLLFLSYINSEIESHMGKDIDLFHKLCNISDLRLPHEIYARTRLMKRKIIFHGGPTNSGKTYHALKRLEQADPKKGGGLYCGPLRLLALEVYEQLNRNGVYTDLLTGQEQRSVPFASHVSCTIEMVNTLDIHFRLISLLDFIREGLRGGCH